MPDPPIILNHPLLTVSPNTEWLELTARELLDQFGAGRHIPGSGSAAAFSGLLAGKLIQTVAKRTIDKLEDAQVVREMEYILNQIEEEHEPTLIKALQEDSVIFNNVIEERLRRNQATDQQVKRRHAEQALRYQRSATELPIEVCEQCLLLAGFATSVFDSGYQAVRGDAGAAGSLAIAGASSAVIVVFLNLKDFREGQWARNIRSQAMRLNREVQAAQTELFQRVVSLQQESEQLDLGLAGDKT